MNSIQQQAPSFSMVADTAKFIADNELQYVLAAFVDIHSLAKTKSVPNGVYFGELVYPAG